MKEGNGEITEQERESDSMEITTQQRGSDVRLVDIVLGPTIARSRSGKVIRATLITFIITPEEEYLL